MGLVKGLRDFALITAIALSFWGVCALALWVVLRLLLLLVR